MGYTAVSTEGSAEYSTEIARGNVPGQAIVNIEGANPDMSLGVSETLWDPTGTISYLAADTTLYLSSTNASDTNVLVIGFGLDDNYNEIIGFATANGQSQVAFDVDFFRPHEFVVTGTTEPLGDLYIAETGTLSGGVPTNVAKIKSKIIQGKNITENGFYTVPAGKTVHGNVVNFFASKGEEIIYNPRIRGEGETFFLSIGTFPIYQSAIELSLKGISITEKIDLEYRGTSDNDNGVGGLFLDLVIIDD